MLYFTVERGLGGASVPLAVLPPRLRSKTTGETPASPPLLPAQDATRAEFVLQPLWGIQTRCDVRTAGLRSRRRGPLSHMDDCEQVLGALLSLR
jgi:hypothetical protein